MVKKCRRCVYSFWHDPRTWQTDSQKDRQTRTCSSVSCSSLRLFSSCLISMYSLRWSRSKWPIRLVVFPLGLLNVLPQLLHVAALLSSVGLKYCHTWLLQRLDSDMMMTMCNLWLTRTTFLVPFIYISAASILVLQRLQRLGRCVCIITLAKSVTRSVQV